MTTIRRLPRRPITPLLGLGASAGVAFAIIHGHDDAWARYLELAPAQRAITCATAGRHLAH